MSDPIRLAVLVAGGRMGRAVIALATQDSRFQLAAAHARTDSEYAGALLTTELDAAVDAADVVIDFTRPELTLEAAEYCAARGKALVSGTTGLSDSQREQLEYAAGKTAMVWAPNMSQGVNLLLGLVRLVARRTPSPIRITAPPMIHLAST
jgi:4-hydroxy-tetrahydrodipicolinate reductase